MSTVWTRITKGLKAQSLTRADLGRAIDVSDQTLYNWSKRGVPASHYAAIARVLRCSIEQLIGEDELPAQEPVADVGPDYSKRASDIAATFDELKDPEVRRKAYSTVMALLQMAKAGQQAPADPPAPTPTPKSRQPAPEPTRARRHSR